MATKTAKNKAAKKGTTKKAKGELQSHGFSPEFTGSPPSSLGKGPKTQSQLIDDAFPERAPAIEKLILQFLEAETGAEEAIARAEDRYKTAQKALKEAVRGAGHDSYSSYDIRYVVELKKLDDKLKVRKVKKKENTPCTTEGGSEE